MSYQVLARKWRPAYFEEMVGQEHVLKALINALNNDRLHHAYLFTGTRGVGKTTLARILAKCLNCEAGVSSKPCGKCSACQEIAEGRFIDLIEVDAASRTKVDDTRELLENVQYTPTRGRYKVYLIDEVHMLSTHSFNALLKTLEEPPPHVKFLLATTDPQKLPVTVLSRCLQFNLKHVPREMIAAHLEKILTAEKVEFEQPALQRLAQAADGSVRDALSLLDQAISYGDGVVRDSEAGQMLGSISRTHLYQLLEALAANDAEVMMQAVDELAVMAPDYKSVLAEMSSLWHHLALQQQLPDATSIQNYGDTERIQALAEKFSPEDIQLYYEITVRAQRDLSIIADGRQGLEMALLRMLAFRPETGEDVKEITRTPVKKKQRAVKVEAEKSREQETVTEAKPAQSGTSENWDEILTQLNLAGMPKAFASHCTLKNIDAGLVTLQVSARHESLHNANVEEKISTALSNYFSQAVKLKIEIVENKPESPAERKQREMQEQQLEAEASIASDPFVESLTEAFDASIIPDSVSPTR
ncbi:MAG TPA: DNA polymerase III subunit gamma/tau [Chromatiales bacterium]|nr:DNA polymerase III subunit gamma/tau [Thiotrichales bacterium]HIP68303.1 DNA polymerase III subunit gamma/tau [Chromatiales bacterium]